MSIEAKRILAAMCIFVAVAVYSSIAFAGLDLIPGESDYYSIREGKKAKPMAVIEGEGFLLGVSVHVGAIVEVILLIVNRSERTLNLRSCDVVFISDGEMVQRISPEEAAFIIRPWGPPPPPVPGFWITGDGKLEKRKLTGDYIGVMMIEGMLEGEYEKRKRLEGELIRDSLSSGVVLAKTTKHGKVLFEIKGEGLKGEMEVRIYSGADDYVSIPFYKDKLVRDNMSHSKFLKKSFGGRGFQPFPQQIVAGNLTSVYYNRGNTNYDKSEGNKRIKDYTAMIKYNPKDAESYFNRGIGYCDKGEYDKAIEDYTEAIRLNPKYADAYHNRGLAYAMKGDEENAIKDLKKAADLGYKESRRGLKEIFNIDY